LLRRRRTRAPAAPVSAARTDVGKVRTVNEDRVLERAELGLWAVADGMGGMRAGDLAAQAVVDSLAALDTVTEDTITDALRAASAAIHASGGGRSGATIVAAHVVTRAIGVSPTVAIDTVRVALAPGDRLFLCSDGVSRSLVAADIAMRDPVATVADRLLAAALERDGSDNASLILIEA
jgi:serine/threonine protein phosphatase PrpC